MVPRKDQRAISVDESGWSISLDTGTGPEKNSGITETLLEKISIRKSRIPEKFPSDKVTETLV